MQETLPALPPPEAELVAAIVPARNEEHQIAACLRSLLAQEWPRLRVICVDDRSEDGTFAAASLGDPRLTVIHGTELPAGWLGKNHANAQGVEHAGDARYLLFTDADSVHAPGALAGAMAAAHSQRADLFTLLTHQRLETFWERALVPQVIAAIIGLYPMRRVNDPRSGTAIANGQYLLIRREVYEAVGGHAAIRDRVADDLELARLVKGRGYKLWAASGRRLVSVRMYNSLREIWWGFAKNSSAGAGGPWMALAGTVLLAVATLPLFAWPFLHGVQLWLALIACACAILQRAIVIRGVFELSPLWALSLPLALPMLVGIVLHSVARQLAGKGPRWKGREYPHGR